MHSWVYLIIVFITVHELEDKLKALEDGMYRISMHLEALPTLFALEFVTPVPPDLSH